MLFCGAAAVSAFISFICGDTFKNFMLGVRNLMYCGIIMFIINYTTWLLALLISAVVL